jgi:hypothetical protein
MPVTHRAAPAGAAVVPDRCLTRRAWPRLTWRPGPRPAHAPIGPQVVFVTTEVAPWSQVGGLGDVMASLPAALAARCAAGRGRGRSGAEQGAGAPPGGAQQLGLRAACAPFTGALPPQVAAPPGP